MATLNFDKPPVLYKYLDASLFKSNYFNNPTLRFTPWNELNDVFDFNPIIKIPEFNDSEVREALEGHCCDANDIIGRRKLECILRISMKEDTFDVTPFLKVLDKYSYKGDFFLDELLCHLKSANTNERIESRSELWKEEASERDFGVLCVSSQPDIHQCWATFNRHAGFVLGIKTIQKRKDFVEVIYTPKRGICFPANSGSQQGTASMFLCKDTSFEHEKEWRYIVEGASKRNVDNNPYLVTIGPKDIHSIVMGYKMSESNRNTIIQYGQKNNIEIFKVTIGTNDNYTLDIVPL